MRLKISDSQMFKQEDLNKRIQDRAYQLYQKRGAVPGSDWQDWLEAEKQIKTEMRFSRK
ncbi:MAG: DUF2934 domain-containing protein [Candidatus Omnitrophica bacterium]|nr:DUF2934 domain-containing protein [Candidatus Omnitrophota bacterium]MDD5236387.1 DUF2934 domain-containing protein [Candidatus Omnitrophota bacterium]